MRSTRLCILVCHNLNLGQRSLTRGVANSLGGKLSLEQRPTHVTAATVRLMYGMGVGNAQKDQGKHVNNVGAVRHFSLSSRSPLEEQREHQSDGSKKGKNEAKTVQVTSFWRKLLNVRQWGLAEVGTAATVLCAMNCTVLPVVLTALPIAQLIDPTTSHHLAHATHAAVQYLVLPVGSLAVGANFVKHKRWDIAALGAVGVSSIAAAHLNILPEWVNAYVTWLNLGGCASLLASGWWSHRVLRQQKRLCCHSS